MNFVEKRLAIIKTLKQLTQNHYFWLIMILLLGYSLRLYALDGVGVNPDETYEYNRRISQSFQKIMVEDLLLNAQSLTLVLDRASMLMMGDRLFSLRWPSLWVSVLGIALIYRLTRGFFGAKVSIFSALLLAISPYAISVVYTLKGYSGVSTFPLLASTLALLALQTNKWRYWLGFSLAAAAMAYNHLFAIIAWSNLVLFIGLIWLYCRVKGQRPPSMIRLAVSLSITWLVLLILFAPIWMKAIQMVDKVNAASSSELLSIVRPEIPASLWTNFFYFSGLTGQKSFVGRPGWPGVYIFLGLIILGGIVGVVRQAHFKVFMILGWASLPFAELWGAQQVLLDFEARPGYLGYTLPPLLMLAALALAQFVEVSSLYPLFKAVSGRLGLSRLRFKRSLVLSVVSLLGFALLIICWQLTLNDMYQLYATGNWRAVGNFLHQNAKADDLIVCHRFDDFWRDSEIDNEDICTRTLNYRREADTPLAAPVYTGHDLVYAVLPNTNSGFEHRIGKVWLVVWNVPDSVKITPQDSPALTEFTGLGRSFVIRADQKQAYINNLFQAFTTLRAKAQSQNQYYLFNSMVAILAAAGGYGDQTQEALTLALKYKPDDPESIAKLEKTKTLAATLAPVSINHPLQIDFGEVIRLQGYNLSAASIKPGATLNLTLFWQAIQNIHTDYIVFLHLRDRTGRIVAQFDYQPFQGSYPTRHWQPGQQLADSHNLPIPAQLPPGQYNVVVGFYNPQTLERLPLLKDQSGENAFLLTQLTVE